MTLLVAVVEVIIDVTAIEVEAEKTMEMEHCKGFQNYNILW